MKKKYFFFILLSLLSSNAWALRFSNSFIEFELPPLWACQQGPTEWICKVSDQKNSERKSNDAVIILAAKLKGEQDSFEQYKSFLQKPRTIKGPRGDVLVAKMQYVRETDIGGHRWIDSEQINSELQDYRTRYLATIRDDVGVLLSYSMRKEKFNLYAPQFEEMVRTVRVFRKKDQTQATLAKNSINAPISSQTLSDMPLGPPPEIEPPNIPKKNPPTQPQANNDRNDLFLALGAGLAALVIYVIKRRSNKT